MAASVSAAPLPPLPREARRARARRLATPVVCAYSATTRFSSRSTHLSSKMWRNTICVGAGESRDTQVRLVVVGQAAAGCGSKLRGHCPKNAQHAGRHTIT